MNNKQLAIVIASTVFISLILAWTIEKAQIRRFIFEFDQWYEGRFSGNAD